MVLGFIGAGNMGGAYIKALNNEVYFYEKNKEELAKLYIPKQNLNIKIRYIILSDGNTKTINRLLLLPHRTPYLLPNSYHKL